MQYMGSKRVVMKIVLPLLQQIRGDRPWVEPFVGGFNSILNVGGERYGNDKNKYIIALVEEVRRGWVFGGVVDRAEYKNVLNNMDDYEDHYVGFVLCLCSFRCKWRGGFSWSIQRPNPRYILGMKALIKERDRYKGIHLSSGDYRDMKFPDNSFIYCDPPYRGATGYAGLSLSHDEFWEWAIDMSGLGHIVVVSETVAPDFAQEIFSRDTRVLKGESNKILSDRMFII